MRKKPTLGLLAAALCAGLLTPLPTASAAPALPTAPAESYAHDGPRAIGLAGDRLVAFTTRVPDRTVDLGRIRGLEGDTRLVGIDHRVQDGAVYGVGEVGGVYRLDLDSPRGGADGPGGGLGSGVLGDLLPGLGLFGPRGAEATPTGGEAPATTPRPAGVRAEKVSRLSVPLEGALFGVDFNPAANRLRVISDTGQNLRHNIDDPMGAPAPGVTVVDGSLTGPDGAVLTGVTGAAYTNDDLDPATSTTLFTLDTAMNRVLVQSPANDGTSAPTGALGVDPGPDAGFDIHTDPVSGVNTAYAVLRVDGRERLYLVDVLSGSAQPLGDFPRGSRVTDLTVLPD
ncbi:DUF4394 domain-containing protein [Streptomyces sp. ST2-7A]|uniref:DUF4394 domain-containing protein n=1 Tax=Streptomyces sp. ST2-7A TaxID=2907214 RepID=UPI001F3B8E5C|nr:DUF4394 domain-containing protein [Streptomyces sp. ST2-7A]MCE7079016.1 DUF4394 domain-containing protein [Streptomyces sp. ST2-7A]